MLYSLKYSLKDEPSSSVAACHETDDLVQTYLNGQFISSSEAWADILNDPPVTFTRQCPLLFPSWVITIDQPQQGDWRRYVDRMPYREAAALRHGSVRGIPGVTLQLIVFFATASKMLR